MALEVIGAGFGRTGTLSLKTALEQLGFTRCYHMYEVMTHLDHAPVWLALDRGDDVDLETLFDGYRATVDWPACAFWRELSEAYPDAKVVLSVRPPDRWFASFAETIHAVLTNPRELPDDAPQLFKDLVEMAQRVVGRRSFGETFLELDRAGLIDAYQAHNAAVRDGVDPARLVELDVADGWEPLCAHLGVPVPDASFPNMNDRAEFRRLFGLDEAEARAADVTPEQWQQRFATGGAE